MLINPKHLVDNCRLLRLGSVVSFYPGSQNQTDEMHKHLPVDLNLAWHCLCVEQNCTESCKNINLDILWITIIPDVVLGKLVMPFILKGKGNIFGLC